MKMRSHATKSRPRSGAEHSPGRSPSRLDQGVKPTWRIYVHMARAGVPGVVPYSRVSPPSATATASSSDRARLTSPPLAAFSRRPGDNPFNQPATAQQRGNAAGCVTRRTGAMLYPAERKSLAGSRVRFRSSHKQNVTCARGELSNIQNVWPTGAAPPSPDRIAARPEA
jgi:hypothetical protein